MSVSSVRLLHVGQSGDWTAQKRTYKGRYLVKTTHATDGQNVVLSDPRLPFYGSFFNFNGAVDPLAICTAKNASRNEQTLTVWYVDATWETQDRQDPNDQKQDDNGKPSDDPEKWRDKWEWVGAKFTGPLDDAICVSDAIPLIRPRGSAGPPVNAAGDVFDPPEQKDISRVGLRITTTRRVFPTAQALQYRDAINKDAFFIRKPGLSLRVLPFQAKLEPINGVGLWYRRPDGREIPYAQIVYEISLRDEGWRFPILNRGFNRRQLDSDEDDNGNIISPHDVGKKANRTKIKNSDGEDTNTVCLLDFDGQPLNKDQQPTKILYAGYPELRFAPLKIWD